jgi:hypothetical protein
LRPEPEKRKAQESGQKLVQTAYLSAAARSGSGLQPSVARFLRFVFLFRQRKKVFAPACRLFHGGNTSRP